MANSPRKNSDQNQQYIPKPYKDVAKGMEAQFTQFMLTKMNDSISRTKPLDSAGNYYESVMTEERAKILSEKGQGIGIQNLILDQLYPSRFRNKLAYNGYLQQEKNKNAFSKTKIEQHELKIPKITIHTGEKPTEEKVTNALRAYQKEVNYE